MKNIRTGSIVYVDSKRAWDSFPGSHGFHRSIVVYSSLGLILRKKSNYFHLLIGDREAWIEEFAVKYSLDN